MTASVSPRSPLGPMAFNGGRPPDRAGWGAGPSGAAGTHGQKGRGMSPVWAVQTEVKSGRFPAKTPAIDGKGGNV